MAEQATRVEGAEPPPPGQSADLAHPEDALHSISLATAVLTLILPMPFLLLRVYTPWKLRSPPKVDDWSCVAAVLFGIAYLASGIVFAEHGGGHHVWEVTISQLQAILETTYWNSIIYSPAAFLIKTTLLLIAVRAFHGNRLLVYMGYCLMTVMVGYYVPVTVLKIMTCRPIQGYWDYGEDSSCYDYRQVFLSDAIGASVTDILVLLMAVPFLWTSWRPRAKMWLILGAGSVATAISLVRLVLVICLQETNDPTLDFVRLSLFGQIEVAIGLICVCLPTVDEYLQSRKRPESNFQRPRLSMRLRSRSFLKMDRVRSQGLSTSGRAAPASYAAPGIRVERDIMITGAYSPGTYLRPPSYSLQPSTTQFYTTPSNSLDRAALDTTTVRQTNEEAPPIPEKSSARFSIHRNSWGPSTTLDRYMKSSTQVPESDEVTESSPETQSSTLLQEKEWLPCIPPPLFSDVRGILPIPGIAMPASSNSSAQYSPRLVMRSPKRIRGPRSPTRAPSPPLSPAQDLLQYFQPPPLWQKRYSDHDYRHYSV